MKLQFGSAFTRNYLSALALVALLMAAPRSGSAQEPVTSDVTTTGGAVHRCSYSQPAPTSSPQPSRNGEAAQRPKWALGPRRRLAGSISAGQTQAQTDTSRPSKSPTRPAHQWHKDWWFRVGAAGTNTPDGGFSLGDDDAYWFVITFNGNVGMGLNVKDHCRTPCRWPSGAFENGGVWTNSSDRNLKENFTRINNIDLLTKINGMAIETWNYKSEGRAVRH